MSEFDPKDRFDDQPEGPRGSNGKNGKNGKNGSQGTNGDDSSYRYRNRDSAMMLSAYRAEAGKSPSQTGDLTLGEVVARLRILMAIIRNRWLPGAAAALIVAGVFAYLYVRAQPEHTAVTTMLAQSTLDELLRSNGGSGGAKKDSQENFLHNHLSVMKSRRFSVALASEFTEEERAAIVAPYMNPEHEASEASLASFEQMLAWRTDAERLRDREFFTLSFRHRDPDIAVMVADRMTATYLKLVQQEIKGANRSAAEMLRVQAEQLQAEISALEEKQREFRKEHNIVSLQENKGLLAERLRRIDRSRSEARIERFKLESQLADAKRDMQAEGLPFHNPLLAEFANNQELREEFDALEAERKVLALRYGRNHPKMRDLDGRIVSVQENLEKNFDLAYRDLENQYHNVLSVEQQLEDEFNVEFSEGIEIGRLANQFLVISSEVDAKREALRDILRRVSTAVVVSNLPADVMRVVDPAFVVKPRLAKQKLTLVFGIMLAGGAFAGIPLLLHLFDQRLKCATDIEKELSKPLLGGVPRLSRIRAGDRPHLVRDNIDPSKVERFMAIIAQIELTSTQEGAKSFVVTSTAPSEGKSTITSNLAAGYTQLGRKTLIIDGDLRRPCQHQLYHVRKESGLIWWAEAGFPSDDLFGEASPLGIQKLENGGYLLPAGGVYPQPAQLLVSSHVEKLFEKLREHFDIIIVDTPPVGLFPDALVLAQSVGETLLIAREATAPVAQIRRVIADIDNTVAPALGVILNDYSAGSLNPRLAYGGSFDRYSYLMKKREREKRKTAPASKSLISRLLAEEKQKQTRRG